MDQIFRDNLPFMTGGIITGAILTFLPRQTNQCQRLSRTILALSVLYPVLIILLYLLRDHLGESYAYLIYGAVLGILLGTIAGIVALAWLIVFIKIFKRAKSK
jgi:hypothetical protein